MSTSSDYVYPQPGQYDSAIGAETQRLGGLTLRDHFAGLAMQGLLAHDNYVNSSLDSLATEAYQQADAMLEARKEESK